MYYKATIEVLVDANSEAEASDAISEALRPILREFEPASSVIDWRYAQNAASYPYPAPHDGGGFEYA